jgi:hypothetical protein
MVKGAIFTTVFGQKNVAMVKVKRAHCKQQMLPWLKEVSYSLSRIAKTMEA